jgi:hypothetical protein
MDDDDIDPGSLSGDALTQWYLRSPDEIEQARQKAFAQRYDDFFRHPPIPDPDPGFDRPLPNAGKDIDPGFSRDIDVSKSDPDPGFTWVQVGDNRWRSVPVSSANLAPMPDTSYSSSADNVGAILDKGLAGSDDGAELIDVGNPANPRLRREHIRKYGYWPTVPETGRNFDVAHIVAKADGGTDTLDNIRPMHPDDHRAEHMANGDFGRWGARSGNKAAPGAPAVGSGPVKDIPRIPGGEIPRFKVPGIGLISPLSDILGMISGRIRTDNFDNFSSDMMGLPSQEDIRQQNERIQKQLFPQAKPGEIWA